MTTYEIALERLRANGLDGLAALPEQALRRCLKYGKGHPLFDTIERVPSAATAPPAVVVETDCCLRAVEQWSRSEEASGLRACVDNKKNALGNAPHDASGVLAELRAFGSMLSTLGEIVHVPVMPIPRRKNQRTPDFSLGVPLGAVVEVCCLRRNDRESQGQRETDAVLPVLEERSRQAATDAAAAHPGKSALANASARIPSGQRRVDVSTTAIPLPNGRILTSCIALRESSPQGPDKGGVVHTIASRIAGKKSPGQVPADSAGVLWLDCSDPTWPLDAEKTQPVLVQWQGLNLATTFGVWHAFYGQKDVTPMMDCAPVGFPVDRSELISTLQQFPGRFWNPEEACWSAAVLKCVDKLVIFENPNATVPLPLNVLRGLTALRGYCPIRSVHRYSERDETLMQRLGTMEDQLRYMAARRPLNDGGSSP